MPPPGPVSTPRVHDPPTTHLILTVSVKVRVAVLVAFVAVIVYAVAPCTVVGVPVNNPVDALNEVPAGAAGLIA